MREIKFRAWYKPFKDNNFGAGYKYGNNVISFHNMSPEKYELEQYTGLHNDDGAELYEGDILLDPDTGYIVGAIEYKDDSFWCGDYWLIDCTDCQVVGNIHENPELLEVDE